MRLTECEATNFMGFSHLKLELEQDMVVLLADNGVGKSSALKAMRVALGGWMLGIPEVSSVSIEPWMMRYELKRRGYELVKAQTGPAVIRAVAEFDGGGIVEWRRSRKGGKRARTDRKDANSIRDRAEECVQTGPLPLLAYYGARRRVPYPIEPRGSGPQEQTRGYDGALDSSIDFADRFARWRRLRDQAAHGEEAVPVYNALKEALVALLPGVSGVEFDADLGEPVVSFDGHTSGGGLRAFSALSDGFQNIMGLGLDLALRAIQLNPELGAGVLQETTGVVLIDEADQHLHPAWQAQVAEGLRQAFPRVQFVLATHSPLMAMGAAAHAQIIRLRSTEEGVVADTLPPSTFGATVDDTLRGEPFGVATTWTPAMLDLVKTRLELLRRQRKDPNTLKPEELEANAVEIQTFRGGPVTHTEDVVRLVVHDLTRDMDSLTSQQLAALRQTVADRVRESSKS